MIERQIDKNSEIYNDYQLLTIKVDTLAKLKISEKMDCKTGEIVHTPYLYPSSRLSSHKKTNIIIGPDGNVVYPQSLYLVYKLRGEAAVKDTGSIAKALLMYTRFLESTHHIRVDKQGKEVPPEYLTYKSLSKYEEEGAPWQFGEYLLANCRHANSEGDEALALSTAKTYMGHVIGFYKWLQRFGYIKNDENNVVTHFTQTKVPQTDQHDILAHIKSEPYRINETSNLMGMFPKSDTTPPHKKLKPMNFYHLALFEKYVEFLPSPFSLMFKLIAQTGLRIHEVTHFPAHKIGEEDYSGLESVPIEISVTKGGKPRTIEVPLELYEELEQYKESEQRAKNLEKREGLISSGEAFGHLDFMFLSNKGKPYSESTLESHFAKLRKSIQKEDPSWYYRVHDLRSTFASHWLLNERKKRNVSYYYLMDELKDLMGHSSTIMTEKYIKFMEEREHKLGVAKRKNNKINKK